MTKRTTKKTQKTSEKQPWPVGGPIPSFASAEQEEAFWLSHSFDDLMEAGGEELVYEPRATNQPRQHVYRVRLDSREMAILQRLARRRGVAGSVVIREFLRKEGESL